jgi:S1-C subfamily serine protease
MDGSQIYDMYNTTIVTVISKMGDEVYSYGSGFFISDNGYIVTSGHNCTGSSKVSILYNNSIYKTKVIGIDKRTDLSILKIKVSNVKYLTFENDRDAKSGEVCYILGNHTDSAQCICHIGNIKFNKYLSTEVFESIVVDVNVNKGTSGSPILNADGNIIGIINWFMDRDCSGGVTSKYMSEISRRIINGSFKKAHIGINTKQLKLQDIIHYDINMAKQKVRGEIVVEDNDVLDIKKNDIIVSVNNENIGVLDSNIESSVYLLKPGDDVEVSYYKFSPENGMSWNTYEYTKNITITEYPESKDHAIIGKTKIRFN